MAKKSPNSVDKHVGARIRMRRLTLGMSQTTLGDALGVSFQQVQKYEQGTNRVGASRLQQIATALQVPIPYFFERAPVVPAGSKMKLGSKMPSPDFATQFLSTSEGLSLVRAFTRVKDRRLRLKIVKFIEQITP
jgi:transcriptional regulator with XRE-family HTH domain